MTDMQQFKIAEDSFKKIRKRSLAILIAAAIVTVITLVLVNIFSAKADEINTLPYIIPVVVAYISFSFYRTLRRQNKFLLGYSVTISDEGLTREQPNTPPLSISFMEIKEILKTKKGSFMVKGVDRTDVIHIPYLIENPGRLEECLSALAPITVAANDPYYKRYKVVLLLLAVGIFIYLYNGTNKVLVGIGGISLAGLLGWAFYEIRTSKNVMRSTKRASWYLLFLIIAILFITITKLAGGIWGPH